MLISELVPGQEFLMFHNEASRQCQYVEIFNDGIRDMARVIVDSDGRAEPVETLVDPAAECMLVPPVEGADEYEFIPGLLRASGWEQCSETIHQFYDAEFLREFPPFTTGKVYPSIAIDYASSFIGEYDDAGVCLQSAQFSLQPATPAGESYGPAVDIEQGEPGDTLQEGDTLRLLELVHYNAEGEPYGSTDVNVNKSELHTVMVFLAALDKNFLTRE